MCIPPIFGSSQPRQVSEATVYCPSFLPRRWRGFLGIFFSVPGKEQLVTVTVQLELVTSVELFVQGWSSCQDQRLPAIGVKY